MLTAGHVNVHGARRLVGSASPVVVAVAVGVIATLALVGRAEPPATPPPPPPATAGLAPDPAAIRYRFAPAAAPGEAELAATLAALEARVRGTAISPFDLAELGELYLKRAQLTGDARDHAEADAAARRSLAILRRPNPAVLVLAKLANARHDFRAAIELAREQLAQAPSRAGYGVLATAHLALGELPQAGDAAERALALAPDSSGYLQRALVLQAQGRDAEAAFDFARAVTVEDHGARTEAARLRALWARFLMRRGEATAAAHLLEEALRIVPESSLALALSGELALRTGKPAQARALFERAFAGARQVRYLIDEARAQQLAGDAAGANALRDQVERLVRAELGEGGLGHRLDLVELLVDRGRPADLPEAIALARAEVVLRPSADVRFQLARALARGGAVAEAQDQVRAALATGAREPELYELAARLEQQRGNAARATLYRGEARRLDPADAGWRALAAGAAR